MLWHRSVTFQLCKQSDSLKTTEGDTPSPLGSLQYVVLFFALYVKQDTVFSLLVLEIFTLVVLGVFMALLRDASLVVFRKFSGLYASLTVYELQTPNSELSYVLNDCGLRLQRSQPFSRSCSAFWERMVVSWPFFWHSQTIVCIEGTDLFDHLWRLRPKPKA